MGSWQETHLVSDTKFLRFRFFVPFPPKAFRLDKVGLFDEYFYIWFVTAPERKFQQI